jgi:hypothetical protein
MSEEDDMANQPAEQQPQQIQVNTADELSRGRYSNNILIAHNQEEFILDWMLNSPNGTHLVSRLIVAPGHMKRVVAVLADNLRRYEQTFGPIMTPEPGDQKFH